MKSWEERILSKTIQLPKKRLSVSKRNTVRGLLFALPWLIGFLCFQLYPIVCALYYSLTDFNIFNTPKFVGLKNYQTILSDPKVTQSLGNTLYMVLLGLPIGLLMALLLALLMNKNKRGSGLVRTAFYIPTVIPLVAACMLFLWLLNPEYGLIGYVFKVLGLTSPSWISDPKYTKAALVILDSWRCGQSAIIFLAGLQAIPRNYYEAADIDGANWWQKFWRITVPSIAPTLQFLLIMGVIQSFQYFTQGFVFASYSSEQFNITGGPKNSLLFYGLYLYQNAFSYLKMGYASALAILMFLIVAVITIITFRTIEKHISYEAD